MDNDILQQVALTNLPNTVCALTRRPIHDAAVMHRDLSDNWPPDLNDMRNDALNNILIVERDVRDRYYDKLKDVGIVVALSGGLDSTTVLHWAMNLFGSVHCVLFDYDQRHRVEIIKARQYVNDLMQKANVDCKLTMQMVKIDVINELARSSLTRDDIEVPDNKIVDTTGNDLPNTWVPGRNIYFITALSQIAFAKGYRHIALGVNAVDYSGYPDCRPEFIKYMMQALIVGVFNGVDFAIHTPLIYLKKQDIIRLGQWLGVDYAKTHSCYNGVVGGCGQCDSCKIRRDAFAVLGQTDPAVASV